MGRGSKKLLLTVPRLTASIPKALITKIVAMFQKLSASCGFSSLSLNYFPAAPLATIPTLTATSVCRNLAASADGLTSTGLLRKISHLHFSKTFGIALDSPLCYDRKPLYKDEPTEPRIAQ